MALTLVQKILAFLGDAPAFGNFGWDGTSLYPVHALVDETGELVPIAGGLATRKAGSLGTDYSSAGAATVPIGAPNTLLATILANPARLHVEIQNQCPNTIWVVRDNGTNGSPATPIALAPASDVNQQGGGWSSDTFQGRIRVFGLNGSIFGAYED